MESVTVRVDGYEVQGVLENPSAEDVVVFVHGFTGDMHGPSDIFDRLSERLQADGFAVLRFNCRGTPPSTMPFEEMTVETETQDVRAVLDYLSSQGYDDIGVVAESMGGTVVANAAPQGLCALVFWYPAFDLGDTSLQAFLEPEKQRELRENGFVDDDGFKVGPDFIESIPRIDVSDAVSSISAPVLFVHGDEDTTVPCEQSRQAFKMCSDPKQLHIIGGADHCFRDEQGEAVKVTSEFFADNW